jgi:hypothetical protein
MISLMIIGNIRKSGLTLKDKVKKAPIEVQLEVCDCLEVIV